MSDNKFRVIIAGAGPVGLYLAHALTAANIDFIVLEQQKTVYNYSGALILTWPHTVRLFDQIGVLETVKQHSVDILEKRRVFGDDGTVLTTSRFFSLMPDKHGYPFLALLRSDIVKILYDSLPDKEKKVKTSAEVVDIKTYPDGVHVHLKDGTIQKGSILIGADGVHSKTRRAMQALGLAENPKAFSNMDENPMVTSFHGVLGRAPNTLGLEEGIFFESRGDVGIQCSAEEGTIYFATLKPLPVPIRGRKRYTPEEMEEHAASVSDIFVAPGVKFKHLWAIADKSRTIMLNQEEGWADRWHHGRIALVGDSAHKATSINGLGLTNGLHSAAALANELQSLLAVSNQPNTNLVSQAFEKYQRARQDEARVVCTRGWNMIREMTRKTWANWFWDRFILPWTDVESVARGLFVSLLLVRHGQVLSYVPFEGEKGSVAWVKRVLASNKS